MSGPWKSAGEKPQIAEGTKLAVRMIGSRFGVSLVEEVDGYYLNGYGLHYVDGCECFAYDDATDSYPKERDAHEQHGCPHYGFHIVAPDEDGEFPEGIYESFRAVEWCER